MLVCGGVENREGGSVRSLGELIFRKRRGSCAETQGDVGIEGSYLPPGYILALSRTTQSGGHTQRYAD